MASVIENSYTTEREVRILIIMFNLTILIFLSNMTYERLKYQFTLYLSNELRD